MIRVEAQPEPPGFDEKVRQPGRARRPDLAFEWSNYRLATLYVNGRKGSHQDVLDPFEIEEGWFTLDLGTFEVRPGVHLEPELRARVQATIDRLDLNAPTYCDARAAYHDECLGLGGASPLGFDWLERECPFVARWMERPTDDSGSRQA